MRSLISLILFSIFTIHSVAQESPKAKNVILLIGDGMGLTQVSARLQLDPSKSNFTRFNNIGLMNTSSASHKITDSGAGATAFACGVKTYNGAIGVGPDSLPRKNLSEIFIEKNKKVGLITTSAITHATTASFFAHEKNRENEIEIAKQLIDSKIHFSSGGGKRFLREVYKQLDTTENTITLETFFDEGSAKRIYLHSEKGMPKLSEGRGDYLVEYSKIALEEISNQNGFLLVVEGAQIDWGGHANDHEYQLSELVDFDKVVGLALDFAEENGETLVIVLGDHETGGYSLQSTKFTDANGNSRSDYNLIDPVFSTTGHTSTLIPVYSFGPGSGNFRGFYENQEIFFKILNSIE